MCIIIIFRVQTYPRIDFIKEVMTTRVCLSVWSRFVLVKSSDQRAQIIKITLKLWRVGSIWICWVLCCTEVRHNIRDTFTKCLKSAISSLVLVNGRMYLNTAACMLCFKGSKLPPTPGAGPPFQASIQEICYEWMCVRWEACVCVCMCVRIHFHLPGAAVIFPPYPP